MTKIDIHQINVNPESKLAVLGLMIKMHDAIMMHAENNQYSLANGLLFYDNTKEIPEMSLLSLEILKSVINNPFSYKKTTPLKTTIASMLKDETTLQINENQIKVRYQRTKDTINELLNIIGNDGKEKIALAVPNWYFWEATNFKNYEFFKATNQEELVENFRTVAKNNNVKGFLIPSTTNPLDYIIAPKIAKEIDEIALKYGIEIIIDDVSRGVRPIGERESIAKYFSKPYIIEGFSKRFGEGDISNISYIYVPENCSKQIISEDKNVAVNELLPMLNEYTKIPVQKELEERNKLFDTELINIAGITPYRSFKTNITNIISIPDSRFNNEEFAQYAEKNDVSIIPIEVFYPEGYSKEPNKTPLFRASVGRLSGEKLSKAAYELAKTIQHSRK